MDGSPWIWLWVWLAAILVVAEILTLGLFMLPFGLGAAAAAIGTWLGLGPAGQWAVFGGVSVVCLVGMRWYAAVHNRGPSMAIGGDRLVGRTGVVIETIDRGSGSGRVRVEREEWRADSSDGADIPAGTRVVVHRVEGTHLVVHTEDSQ